MSRSEWQTRRPRRTLRRRLTLHSALMPLNAAQLSPYAYNYIVDRPWGLFLLNRR